MKNKILGGMAVLIIATVAMFNVNIGSKSSKLSDISLANVEALAQEPNGTTCYAAPPYTDYCNIYANGYYCPCGW